MQTFTVRKEESGQRLDKYIRRRLPLAPFSFIYRMLRKKNITLRGKKADGSERIETGDTVEFFLSDETIAGFSHAEDDPEVRAQKAEEERALHILGPLLGKTPVLYEDENILIVRKPPGILSQKAQSKDLSMNEWLRGYLGAKREGSTDGFHPSVCNRLDRNTGGILLCAKTLPGSRALSAVIRERTIRKTYRMVVHGQLRSAGTVKGLLVKDKEKNNVRIAESEGVEAVTKYRPLKTGRFATLAEAELITGRSHQLRVHMASIGHPIVSDPRYGNREKDRALFDELQKEQRQGQKSRRGQAGKGQLLWCTQVTFPVASDPFTQQILGPLAGQTISCPEPAWWKEYVS